MRWLDSIINSMDMNLRKLRDSEGQGSLVCCSPRGCKELDRLSDLTATTLQDNENINVISTEGVGTEFIFTLEKTSIKD